MLNKACAGVCFVAATVIVAGGVELGPISVGVLYIALGVAFLTINK